MADKLRKNFSKYSSYPAIMHQLLYCKTRKERKELYKELEDLGMNTSGYYHVYKMAFSALGVRRVTKLVANVKKIMGRRPNF